MRFSKLFIYEKRIQTMKITKTQLQKIVKEEIKKVQTEIKIGDQIGTSTNRLTIPPGSSPKAEEDTAESDILDAIQMLENEEDPSGTLFHVINRLHTALEKL